MRIGRRTANSRLRHIRILALSISLGASTLLAGCTQPEVSDLARFWIDLARNALAGWLL